MIEPNGYAQEQATQNNPLAIVEHQAGPVHSYEIHFMDCNGTDRSCVPTDASERGCFHMRKNRNFDSRPRSQQEWILRNTWCSHCDEANLGMNAPEEYEAHGRIFVQGKCKRCGMVIVNEIKTGDI